MIFSLYRLKHWADLYINIYSLESIYKDYLVIYEVSVHFSAKFALFDICHLRTITESPKVVIFS